VSRQQKPVHYESFGRKSRRFDWQKRVALTGIEPVFRP
jgi:hypothetical protein